MRFANHKVTHFKTEGREESKFQCRNHSNCLLEASKYYMHYNNGVYMGGIISYKRNGQGIILLDKGTSAITDYCFDTMVGHNILFRDNQIMSILYTKNSQYEIAFKTGAFILKIPYYEGSKPNGNGILIDYESKIIYHLIYKHGDIVKKIIQTNKNIIGCVFNSHLENVIDVRHEKAFKFSLKLENGIKIIKEKKKITIGYIDHRNTLEGLCFKLKVSQDYEDFNIPFESKCIQRGHYRRNQLEDYGQRYFANGNLYIGQFQEDTFEKKGILMYPKQLKWAYGEFQDGKLTNMILMDTGQNQAKSVQRLKRSLKQIHEFNTRNWMSIDFQFISWEFLIQKLEDAINSPITAVAVQKQRQIQQTKNRLNKIQQFFLIEKPNNSIDTTLIEQLSKSKEKPDLVTLNQKGTLKSLTIKVEEPCPENLKFLSSPRNESYYSTKRSLFQTMNSPGSSPQSNKSDRFFEKTFDTKANYEEFIKLNVDKQRQQKKIKRQNTYNNVTKYTPYRRT